MTFRSLKRQNSGSALLVFIVIISILALTFVVGLGHQFVTAQHVQLIERQKSYLAVFAQRMADAYHDRANDPLRHPAGTRHSEIPGGMDVTDWPNMAPKFGAQAVISNRLANPEGFFYRRIAVWLPTEDELANPPDVEKFVTTGVFDSCTLPPCQSRVYEVYDSSSDERGRFDVTRKRLGQLALRSQSYFLTRQLQDPERNVSVNYFRDPVGNCAQLTADIGCIDNWTRVENTAIPRLLDLSPGDLISQWGTAIEVINDAPEAQVDDAPFSLVYRTCTDTRPSCIRVVAVEQL